MILFTGKFWRPFSMLLLVASLVFGIFVTYDAPGALAPTLKDSGFSTSDIGILYSTYSIPACITVAIGGLMIDRIGVKVCVTYILSVLVVAAVIGALATPSGYTDSPGRFMPWLILGRLLLGAHGEILYAAQGRMLNIWIPQTRLGIAFTMSFAIGVLGTFTCLNVLPPLATAVGTQGAMWFPVGSVARLGLRNGLADGRISSKAVLAGAQVFLASLLTLQLATSLACLLSLGGFLLYCYLDRRWARHRQPARRAHSHPETTRVPVSSPTPLGSVALPPQTPLFQPGTPAPQPQPAPDADHPQSEPGAAVAMPTTGSSSDLVPPEEPLPTAIAGVSFVAHPITVGVPPPGASASAPAAAEAEAAADQASPFAPPPQGAAAVSGSVSDEDTNSHVSSPRLAALDAALEEAEGAPDAIPGASEPPALSATEAQGPLPPAARPSLGRRFLAGLKDTGRRIAQFPLAYWLLAGAAMLGNGLLYSFLAFFTDLITEKYADPPLHPVVRVMVCPAMDPTEAARITSFASFISLAAAPISGTLIDRFGLRLVWFTALFGFILLSFILLSFASSSPYITVVALGLISGTQPAIVYPTVGMLLPDEDFATGSGFVGAGSNMVLVVLTWVVGALRDATGSYQSAVNLLIGCCVVALILLVVLSIDDLRHRNRINRRPVNSPTESHPTAGTTGTPEGSAVVSLVVVGSVTMTPQDSHQQASL
ncbi:hypothetical protein PAPYR_9018 [Paratrimastix pyriformis]|uniref:Lysosomal dipeptide transporter MFSD1 n=1 Tax=Paratrimastix pyriformis TaxID=342808 RepID=A0ABQ8U9E2_9EUKA|nr:hypothetical protein PAPYR_9018 [Paratrimastix pyriformis]